MYPFVLSWDLALLVEDDVAGDVAADIGNVAVAVAADGKLWAPGVSSYRWDCQWGRQDNDRKVVPRHGHSVAIAVLHLRMMVVEVVGAMNSMVVPMAVVMMSFAGAAPSERTLVAAAAVAALPPTDECTRIGVSSNAHSHSDQRYSRTAIPLLHNGWIQPGIYPRNWLPVVHAIYFAVSMCANGVQLIPKYQPSLISLHFHLHSVFGMENKEKKNNGLVQSAHLISESFRLKFPQFFWILTACKAPVISSFNSSKQRLMRARRLRSSIGFITLRYWYVRETGSFSCVMHPRLGAIFKCSIYVFNNTQLQNHYFSRSQLEMTNRLLIIHFNIRNT